MGTEEAREYIQKPVQRVVMRDVQTTQTTYQQQEQVSTVQVPVQRQVPRTVQERSTSFINQCVQEEVMVQGPTQYTSQTHCPRPVRQWPQPVPSLLCEQHLMDVECQQCLTAD